MTNKLDAAQWASLEPRYAELEARELSSVTELEGWLLDRSELDAAAEEAHSRAYIRMTCATGEPTVQAEYLRIAQEVCPPTKEAQFRLDRRLANSPLAKELDPKRYAVLLRETRAAVELFREENLSLQAETEGLAQQYNGLIGAMSVELDGEAHTLQEAGLFFDGLDRGKRREAWQACANRRLEDRAAINELFDRQLATRTKMARNAGFENNVGYAFVAKRRFDYTADDCRNLHRSIAESCVPRRQQNLSERASKLGLDALYPWDLFVDPDGQEPLRPFSGVDDLVSGVSRIFHRLDPELGGLFDTLRDGESLDLESRPGKAAGGYQVMLDEVRKPFIFMNAAGTHEDVNTLVHEGGHALHSLLCRDDPLLVYRDCGAEFCEVASMGMELMAHPYLDEFYDAEAAERARRTHLRSILKSLPFIAQIDAFQHWIYTHPEHTHQERDDRWVSLDERFRPGISWDGVEEARRAEWHRVPHLFSHPFYMIEYAIAQLGALELWQHCAEDESRAITNYKRALAFGGSLPLPDLFATAGLSFDFSPETVDRLMRAIVARFSK